MSYTMKSSGVDWIGDIPAHWEVKRLKQVTSIILGKMVTPNPKDEASVKLPYFRAANLTNPKADIYDMWFQPSELNSVLVQQDDVLITEGGDVGFPKHQRSPINNIGFQNSVLSLRGYKSQRYLYYWMEMLYTSGMYKDMTNSVSIAHLTKEKVKELKCLMPSSKEQHAIAQFLDDRTSAIDSKISALEEKEQSLAELRKSIIHEAVTKGLDPKVPMKASGVDWIGDIPAHWEVTRGKNFLKYFKKINKDGIKTKIWSLTLNGVLENDPSNPIGLVPNDYASYQFFETNDLVFKLIDLENTRTSRIGVVPSPGIMSPAYIRMSVKKGVVQYQHWMFKDMWYRNIFNMLGGSGVRSNLTAANLYELVLVQPPLAEQQAIAAYLDERTAVIDQSIDTVKQEVQALQELRKSLIHEAVTGKINVADFGYNY